MAASRQQEQGSRARDTTNCVTRCKNGVNCEVCIFRCYGTQSCATGNRRTVYSQSSLPELALLLSARSPVGPAAFLTRQKWRETRNARFSFSWHSVARVKQQEMMMIAFITIKSSLVPLIEGLCAQIYFGFEISVVCVHIFCFSFSEEKIC